MIRIFAPFTLACVGLLTVASFATAQEPSTGSLIFEAVRPFLIEAATALITAAVLWLSATIRSKLNIDIEARHREALQAALTNAAGLVINRAGGAAAALALPSRDGLLGDGVEYIVKSAPEALKHFGITPETVGAVMKEKLEAKIGVMVASNVSPK